MKKIIETKLFKQLSIITLYFFIIWPLQLLITSFLTFFHLSLDHPLGIIEQWLFVHGPFLIFFSKIPALLVCILFIQSYSSTKHLVKECILHHKSILKQVDILPMVFWFCFVLMMGKPIQSSYININLWGVLFSYFGNVIFWLSDLLLIFLLNFTYPLKTNQKWFSFLYLGLFSAVFFNHLYPYAANFNYFFIFIWPALGHFSFARSYFYLNNEGAIRLVEKESIIRPFVFVILVLGPLAAFCGLDIIWGNEYSFFVCDYKKLWIIGLASFVVHLIYFKWWYSFKSAAYDTESLA